MDAFGNQSRSRAALSLVRGPSHNGPTKMMLHGSAPCAAWRAGTMSDDKLYDIPAEWKQRAYIKEADYQALYERSIKDPNAFWANEAKRIHWYKAPTKIKNVSYGPGNVS